MSEQGKRNTIQAARVYLRVSTEEQDLARQEAIVAGARAADFYVAAVYREKGIGRSAGPA
jgi:DNA invertase Pin-like site-specific DNA recombinase